MAVAVICEFNPFHNGHKYLLETAKSRTKEPVIAVMSTSFTQRGEVAVCDKFQRAKTALQNGADLVVELPVVYALSTAERFAFAGVEIAKAFDCTNYLAFGCENDDIRLLSEASSAVENSDVQTVVKEKMKNGEYYPKALESAVRLVKGDAVADILTKPNNILSVEYLRQIKKSAIKPVAIKRTGADHDSVIASKSIASASFLRELLRNNNFAEAEKYMPCLPDNIIFEENLERIILYKLRSMTAEDFALLPDVSEGLENRIVAAVNTFNSVKEIINGVKTKRYTHARLRRIITCALLGITEELQNTPIEYVRVLGFTAEGADLLRQCGINVVTSAARGLELGENTRKLLEKDIYATDIASLALKKPQNKGIDFTSQIIKIFDDKKKTQ